MLEKNGGGWWVGLEPRGGKQTCGGDGLVSMTHRWWKMGQMHTYGHKNVNAAHITINMWGLVHGTTDLH